MKKTTNGTKNRGYLVAKENSLAMARYSLTVSQQRLLLFLISRIKPNDKPRTAYKVEIKDIIDTCGYDATGGKYYTLIRNDLKIIADSSVWVPDEHGYLNLCRWLDCISFRQNDGCVLFTFHKTMDKYIIRLREKYYRYALMYALMFKLKHSIRIYELMQANKHKGELLIKLDLLKVTIDAPNYKDYSHFRQKLLDPCIREINALSELDISYTPIKEGRAVTELLFKIDTKSVRAKTIVMQLDELSLSRKI